MNSKLFSIDELKFPLIDSEALMDQVIKSIGGCRVEELLTTGHPNFKNADYICEADKVIIELKTFKEEFKFSNYQSFLLKTVKEFIKEPDFKLSTVFNLSQLNDPKKKKIIDFFKKKFKPPIRTANKQIKETKIHLSKL